MTYMTSLSGSSTSVAGSKDISDYFNNNTRTTRMVVALPYLYHDSRDEHVNNIEALV